MNCTIGDRRESKKRIKRGLIRLLFPLVSGRNLRILSICKDRIATGIKYTLLVLISTCIGEKKKKESKRNTIYLEPRWYLIDGSERKDARVKSCKWDVSHPVYDYWICANVTDKLPDR